MPPNVCIFPNDDAIVRLVGALRLEQNDEWTFQRSRYMTPETIPTMSDDPLISHGAPVLQAIEIYRGAPIFVGLGNFLFHLNQGEEVWSAPDVWKSVVATCHFDADAQVQSIDLHPIVIGGERLDARNYHERIVPVPAPKSLAAEMIEALAARSQSHGVSINVDGDHGSVIGC